MRIGYLECFSGISGDMLLGALVDAGLPFACLEETAAALNVGARLEMRKVSRGGLAATKVDVITDEGTEVQGTGNREQGTGDEHSHEHGHLKMNTNTLTLTLTLMRRTARSRRSSQSFAPRR